MLTRPKAITLRAPLVFAAVVASAFFVSVRGASGQAQQSSSPSSAETMEWLTPAFNTNARISWTTTCGGAAPFERSYAESSSIQNHDTSSPVINALDLHQAVSNGDQSFVNSYRLNLAALDPSVSVSKENLQSSGACSKDRSVKYVMFIAATATMGITALGNSVYRRNPPYIEIAFADEAIAKRCAAALSHLMVLAGAKLPKLPPF